MTRYPKKVIVVEIPSGVDEITIKMGKASIPAEKPMRIARCRAIKTNGQRCCHTIRTSWLTERGLCRCSHQGWEVMGRPVVPMADLMVPA